jgi:hypothetical protein
MATGEGLQLRAACHRAVGIQDLADHAGRRQPRQARQVHGSLGLTGPLQNTAGSRPQRKDVAGPAQILRPRPRIDRRPDRRGAIRRADPRRDAVVERRIDGDHEGGPVRVGPEVAHGRESELIDAFGRQRETDQPTSVGGHEIDDVRRDILRRADEVAFVLAVLIVRDDDHLAATDGLDRVLDGVEVHAGRLFANCPQHRGSRD